MSLRDLTLTYIEQHSKNELLIQLKTKRSKQLDAFLAYEQIAEFLDKASYDFSYSSREFIDKLASILEYRDIDKEVFFSEARCHAVKAEQARINSAKVLINFAIGPSSWQGALRYAAIRQVSFDRKKIAYKSNKNSIEFLITVAKKHYQSNPKIDSIAGAIMSYLIELDGARMIYDPSNETFQRLDPDNHRGSLEITMQLI